MSDPHRHRDDPDLLERVYAELRRLAGAYLRRERSDHSLQPTALVHEAIVKLGGQESSWNDTVHYRAVAANAMRQVLIDHAKRRNAQKRGGDRLRVTLHEQATPDRSAEEVEVLALDEAMSALAELDERKARVIELRYFGGLTIEEAAEELGVSTGTVRADWYFARAWLRRRLTEGDG